MQGGERVLAQRHHVVQLAPALPALAFATHRNPGDSSCDAIERTCLEARPLDAPREITRGCQVSDGCRDVLEYQ